MRVQTGFSYIIVFTGIFASGLLNAQNLAESRTESYFASISNDHKKQEQFLLEMPKGGDLHNHPSGAAYAENLLRYAYNDNLCVSADSYMVYSDPNCPSSSLLDNAVKDPSFKDALIDAWSMRHFGDKKAESGHDHFFASFSKFGAVTGNHHGEMYSEIAQRAAAENELYLELMGTLDGNESGKLGSTLGWDPDFGKMREKLLAADFNKIMSDISNNLNQDEAKARSILACDSNQPKPGCNVQIRFLYQVLREQPPEMVFAQLLAGFEAVHHDRRVVGLNMVQAEDGPISMRDYKLQMQMVGYLHQIYPDVRISLHAGELSRAVSTDEGLKFHVHDAVEVAGANRIGHGADIALEDDSYQTLSDMASKHDLVEVNLSSNAEILGIEGKDHPLPLYLKYGVPVTLSTDDEGVSRSNLTKEYLRAVTEFNLDYLTIKAFARNSISYAFIAGKPLWQDYNYQQPVPDCANDVPGSDNPSAACKAFLDASEKAALQWELEKRFNIFEAKF